MNIQTIKEKTTPVLMTKEEWNKTHFAVACRYGSVTIKGHEYVVVNKNGVDLHTLSCKAWKRGEEYILPLGEPADLLRKDFKSLYHKLGRDKFLKVFWGNPKATASELKDIMRKEVCHEA